MTSWGKKQSLMKKKISFLRKKGAYFISSNNLFSKLFAKRKKWNRVFFKISFFLSLKVDLKKLIKNVTKATNDH